MKIVCKILLGLFLITQYACTNTARHKGGIIPKPGLIEKKYEASITKAGNRYIIDTNIIVTNQNLQILINELDTAILTTHTKFRETPKFIKRFLDQFSDTKFLIADSGQEFASGCNRFEGESFRQVQFLGFNDTYFVMAYKIGGIALMGNILIIKFDGNSIIDFWTGGGGLDLNTKQKLIQYLKENKDKERGSHPIYI